MNELIITNEVVAVIVLWILLSFALWGVIDLMNRLSFWGERIVKRFIDRIRNFSFQCEFPDIEDIEP